MRTFSRIGILAALLIAACAGTTARTEVLLPAMQQAWAGIRPAVARYIATIDDQVHNAALAAADASMQSGNPVDVAGVSWQLLDDAHESDVAKRLAAGEIGPGVADSLRERLTQFADARATFIWSK